MTIKVICLNCDNVKTYIRVYFLISLQEGANKMKRCQKCYPNINRIKDSLNYSVFIIGLISTVISIAGFSFGNLPGVGLVWRIIIVVVGFFLLFLALFILIGVIYKKRINLDLNDTQIEVVTGDIFKIDGWKVIGCDTCFRTQVDDVVISKKSLHGKMILEHGDASEIDQLIENEAHKRNVPKNENGQYEFELGTIIPYKSSVDGEIYLMLALTQLDAVYKSHTNMVDYERMLMKMWKEINDVYASYDIVLPLLGTGVTTFDDGPKSKNDLLRYMLCTLKQRNLRYNSKIKIVMNGNNNDIPLYELKGITKGWC